MNILQLRDETKRRGLCEEYAALWDNARTNGDIFNLACSVKGADYICSAIHNGYFLNKDELATLLQEYVNGRRISQQKGYTTALYCQDGDITAKTTVIIAVYGSYSITVPEGHACQIFTAGNTELTVNAQGKAILINYDSITPTVTGNVKTLNPHNNTTSFLHRK